MDSTNSIIKTDNITGTKSSNYNNGTGYKGTGVRIGIIEAGGGKYDADAKQLEGIPETQLEYIGVIDLGEPHVHTYPTDHATKVTSIIVGQSYMLNGKTYEGVVPNAIVYQVGIYDKYDVYQAINDLVNDCGVSVINYSGGSGGGTYTDYDKEVDRLCNSTGVSFVKSAGNSTNINFPGLAYNVITVGNAMTKETVNNNIIYKNSPYVVNPSCSSYEEASYLTNKPDLVAPGTAISCVGANNEILTSSGTSLSAPMVTGVVAQLHQVDPSLISNPTKTKAIILAGADPTLISTVENNSVGSNGLVREKSGVGMLNAVNSINIALNYQSSYAQLFFMQPPAATNYNMGFVNVEKGHTLRVVLTFNKAEDNLLIESAYGNNFDLYVVDSKGNVVSSCSTINNVEVVEVVAPED
ncbi:MAG: S8 family serine peptidase, partial [Clostridia bacterium]|nr:S8 family serine peptidase [Clostridia bacterium]